MKIEKIEMYLDGGTIELTTDKGIYCFDDRIQSNTNGRLYEGYPKDDNSNLIENSKDLEEKLIENLKSFKSDYYQSSIDYFISNYKLKQKPSTMRSFSVGDWVVYKPYENCSQVNISGKGHVNEDLGNGMYSVTFGHTSIHGTRTGKYNWSNLWLV